VALGELLILSLTKAYAPLFGDSALNMATYDLLQSSYGPIQNLDRQLRQLFLTYQKMGITSFKDRIYSHQKSFPPACMECGCSGQPTTCSICGRCLKWLA